MKVGHTPFQICVGVGLVSRSRSSLRIAMDDSCSVSLSTYIQAPWDGFLLLLVLIMVPSIIVLFYCRSRYRTYKALTTDASDVQPENEPQQRSPVEVHIETKPRNPSQILNSGNMQEVLENVWEARQKWYNIGIQLKLDINDLDVIQRQGNNKSPDDYVVDMLKIWLRRKGATWKALIDALRHKTVGYPILANNIATKFALDDVDSDLSDTARGQNEPITTDLSSKPGFKCPRCGNCSFNQYLQGNCPEFKSESDSAFPYLNV